MVGDSMNKKQYIQQAAYYDPPHKIAYSQTMMLKMLSCGL